MKKFIFLILMVLILGGCRESDRVSRNISKNADNFNVVRRLTVFNMRTDKCILCMTGKMSIQNEEIEFMPQAIVPIKVTADELKQELEK